MVYGVGIVGTGMIARFHAKAIAEIDEAKLIGCYNRTADKAQAFAQEQGITAYEELAEMLANPDIHIISICTASGAHMEPAVAAANAGKHVIIEKPLDVTLARCDAIIKACQVNKVKLATIFPSRFHGPSVELKKAIESGRFGRLTMGDAYVKWFRTQEYYDSGAWRGTWELDGGGALMNQAIHSVDLLCWLMGEVAEISGHCSLLAHERIEVEDTAVAALKFKNGALGVIQASTAVYPGYLKRIEIHGSQGSAVMEEEDLKSWEFAETTPEDEAIRDRLAGKTKTGGGAADPKAIGHHGHRAQFEDLIAAIKNGSEPAINGPEGRRSVEVILAIYEAAATGTSVKLPLASDPTDRVSF
ncbi:MAG: Gfo/Idh/MocA family oxidoreductase [Pirellulaceae bacterium]